MSILSMRGRQQGGIVVLACLMLLVFLTVVAFVVSRNVLRETLVTGNVYQAARSESAADAGLDWFMTWSSTWSQSTGSNAPVATPQARIMRELFENLVNRPGWDLPPVELRTRLNDDMTIVGEGEQPVQAFDLDLFVVEKQSSASGGKDIGKSALTQYDYEVRSTGAALVPMAGDQYWRFQSRRAARYKIRQLN